jgi:hypothetical protein
MVTPSFEALLPNFERKETEIGVGVGFSTTKNILFFHELPFMEK